MLIDERLLGFDLRLIDGFPPADWPLNWRDLFLYNLSAVKPLSTDTMVWPSLFDGNGAEPASSGSADLRWSRGLWSNVNEMNAWAETCASNDLRSKDRILVAVTLLVVDDSSFTEIESCDRCLGPDNFPAEWTRFGFDVSDRWLLSGLSNCGFFPGVDDVVSLRSRWFAALNDWHLFINLEDALCFRDFADKHIPEHSPFFVYGIWAPSEDLKIINRYRQVNQGAGD